MFDYTLQEVLIMIVTIIISFSVHEFAHAWTAILFGDDTPRLMGRMTLNPIKHIDPLGMLLILIAGFGWAKPVVIDRSKLKNPGRDDILISLAGPFSNLLLAIVYAAIYKFTIPSLTGLPTQMASILITMIQFGISINIGLFIFNLLPIPPLDGSHLVTAVLSQKSHALTMSYLRFGSFALLGIIIFQNLANIEILPISRGIDSVARLIFSLLRIT